MTHKSYLSLLASVLMLFSASCAKEQLADGYESAQEVSFKGTTAPYVISGSKAGFQPSEGMIIIETDTPIESETKGSVMSSFSLESFHYSAYSFSSWSSSVTPSLAYDDEASLFGGMFIPETPLRWPGNGNNVRFYAWAPDTHVSVVSTASSGGAPVISYTSPASVSDQSDLVEAASADLSDNYDQAVSLTFSHALAALRVVNALPSSVSILGVSVGGVYWSGSHAVGSASWTTSGAKAVKSIDGASVASSQAFFLVPQTCDSGAELRISFRVGGGEAHEAVYSLEDKVFAGGTMYTYSFSAEEIYEASVIAIEGPETLFRNSNSETITVKSAYISGNGTATALSWVAEFSTDGGTTWTTSSPRATSNNAAIISHSNSSGTACEQVKTITLNFYPKMDILFRCRQTVTGRTSNILNIEGYDYTFEGTATGTFSVSFGGIKSITPDSNGNFSVELHEVQPSSTRFSIAYTGKNNLTSITKFPEIKINNLQQAFINCTNLVSISAINTDGCTDFSQCFASCKALKTIGGLDTSNGTSFASMFFRCNQLISVPELDTSKGANFSRMFYECYNITTIPEIDTSNGIDFTAMFKGCTRLTSIPELNTSNGTKFNTNDDGMFENCRSLTSIPLIDTSKETNFVRMFQGCTSLTSLPLLNTSFGNAYWGMFQDCTSLTSIPEIDTSSGTNFGNMFYGCTSLTSVPELDVSSGTYFGNMFFSCSSLTTFGGLLNIKGDSNTYINFSQSPLSHDSLMNIINGLDTATLTNKTIRFGSTNLAKLTAEEIAIATDKGWTLE